MNGFSVVEAGVAELRRALEEGVVTSVELVAQYLNRIARFDRHGERLNAVPVLDPELFAAAAASDARRARGETLGPLDGIPYTAKDSYKVRGLPVASGSPAFQRLVAGDDAFAVARLRAGGAILIGLTNMPPMADGGMQRGVYGRAESPYNRDYLTAAYASGSSNGSGTATAASFAAFGLGEETWSSGRAPASNNGLVAYTPSRGVISIRGNWPLFPLRDVVVPHTRTMDDMLELLDVVVADDEQTRGDFWRAQRWVDLPRPSEVRPASYDELRDRDALRGTRLGVPRMYVNRDSEASEPIVTRDSVIALWEQARRELEALGAEVVEVDFPIVSNQEGDRPGARSAVERGLLPADFETIEHRALSLWAWNDFLEANGDPALPSLADVDADKVFPLPQGSLPDRRAVDEVDVSDYPRWAREQGVPALEQIPTIADGVRGVEEVRRIDLEQWMDAHGLDAVVFPANADVGPADADVDRASADLAWRNGVWVSNGNQAIRMFGIPTVTVPMGLMGDIGMPVGLTFAGRGYDDSALLRYGYAFDAARVRRLAPPRTPDLLRQAWAGAAPGAAPALPAGDAPSLTLAAALEPAPAAGDGGTIVVEGASDGEVHVYVNGEPVAVAREGDAYRAVAPVTANHAIRHSEWREPYGSIVVVVARAAGGATSARHAVVGGIA